MELIDTLRWQLVGRLQPFFRGPDPRHTRQRNIWHLTQDLLWLGLASAAANYINVYAIRLGASEGLLGLRTAIPSLLMVLLRIPAARLTERTVDRKGLIVRSLLVGRLIYFLIFLLPWLLLLPVLRQIPPATLLVVLVVLMGVPQVLSAAGWDTFFADVVPERRRARVVSARNTFAAIISLTMVPLMGSFLEWVPFPLNYQLVFLLAFIGAMLSLWHVKAIQVDPVPVERTEHPPLSFAEGRTILRESPEFAWLVLGTFVYQWAISISAPLFTLYFVNELGATESWIGWRTSIASLMSILAYRLWPKQIEKRGEARMLVLTAPLMALFPLLTGLATTLTPHLFIVLIPQLFGACVMLSRYGILLRVSPADRRPTYIAIYAILVNVAAFVAPLVGVALVDVIGFAGVFFISAGLRLVAALLYRKLQAPHSMRAPHG